MMTPIVETAAGRICGTEAGNGVLAWRGLPYAAAPVGLCGCGFRNQGNRKAVNGDMPSKSRASGAAPRRHGMQPDIPV
jgi:hypothetical protein